MAEAPFRSTFRAASLLALFPAAASVGAGAQIEAGADGRAGWAEIRVTDAATGRGVPLVELETVNSLRFVTDNAGRVAFQEPGLMGKEVFFFVRSHGYEAKKDGFGFAGVRITPRVGKVAEAKVTRKNVAERLCRLTGEGLYRDTILLGHQPSLAPSPHPGNVAGQDSIQAAVHRNKVYCFWGDTSRMAYPLGLFRMAGATHPVPDPNDPASDPAVGLPYDYFVDPKTGFARGMIPIPERPEGVVWVGAVFTVPDDSGAERLVGHYSRRKGLTGEFEQGIALFDDAKQIFAPAKTLPLSETWRRPRGHPVVHEEGGRRWVLFGNPAPTSARRRPSRRSSTRPSTRRSRVRRPAPTRRRPRSSPTPAASRPGGGRGTRPPPTRRRNSTGSRLGS